MPKILFIQPTQYDASGRLCKQKRIYLPGLQFPLLAAMTPREWDVEVNIEVVDTINFDNNADLIAIGTMGHAAFRGLEIADEFKRRGKTVVMGGYMASMMKEEARKHVDAVVVGDAEISFPMMLEDFRSGAKLKDFYDFPVENLNGLPLPRYELLTSKPIGTMLPVQAGRGCPHSCSFCSIACLYRGRYLNRPVHEVVRDVRRVKELGFKSFYLIDDNIVSQPGYFRELCLAFKPLKMRWSTQCSLFLADNKELLALAAEAGADMFSFGVESITQEGLDALGKPWLKVEEHERRIREIANHGLLVSTEMIVGTDSDTEESLEATYAFVIRNRLAIPRFYILTPIPGTELWKRYRSEGRLLTEKLSDYSTIKAVHKPARISPEALDSAFWRIYQKVFRLGSILRRTLLHPQFWKNPKAYLFALFVNLHYRKYVLRGVPPNIF